MPIVPPTPLLTSIRRAIRDELQRNPMATNSESYVQHVVEFRLLNEKLTEPYHLRIGINYHGHKVQHIQLDPNGHLVGWNPTGEALGTSSNAKILLANVTIFDRDEDEQLMSDCKVGGGSIPPGKYVRIEFKVRGWLGKTKNLDGSQLEKDLDLLHNDRADLLVICLSETAHLKWRGGGPIHQVSRRSGVGRFRRILVDPASVTSWPAIRDFTFESQPWTTVTDRIVGRADSALPGAIHYATYVWRRDVVLNADVAPSP